MCLGHFPRGNMEDLELWILDLAWPSPRPQPFGALTSRHTVSLSLSDSCPFSISVFQINKFLLKSLWKMELKVSLFQKCRIV